MRTRLISTALAAAFFSGAGAQVIPGTPAATSFFQRGTAFFAEKNYTGTSDQLSLVKRLGSSVSEEESAAYLNAVAQLRLNNPYARDLILDFLNRYPASALRNSARTALGDTFYDENDRRKALEVYNTVNEDALDSGTVDSFRYHKAFCLLTEGDLDAAATYYARLSSSKTYSNRAKFFNAYIAYSRRDYNGALTLFRDVAPEDEGPVSMTDFYLSQIYYNKGDWNLASSSALRALENGNVPDSFRAEAERVAGESAYNLGDDSSAISHLKKYTSLVTEPLPSALYILGVSEYRKGDYRQAVTTLTPVTNEDNVLGQSANLYIGQANAKTGNFTGAMFAFDKAYRMGFDGSIQETALYNYAVAKSEGGKIPFGSSVSAFETFLRKYPDSKYAAEVEEYIITGYMTDNNYAAALRSIDAIKNPSENILKAKQQVLYTLGTKELAQNDAVGALNRFRQAKALGNINKEVYPELDLWIAESLYKGKSYSAAASSYRSYLNGNRKAVNRAAADYGLGYALFGEKKFSEAYTPFNSFISAPGNASGTMIADALNRMGDCRYYESDFENAAALYDRAYNTDPATGDYALFQKAMMKGLRRKHSEKIAGMEEMMRKFPSSALAPQALLEIADAYNETGDTRNVIATYRKLSEKYPETAQGRQGQLLLAITYLNNDRTNDAADTYRGLIRNYPTSEEAKVAADDLKRIYADRGTLSEFVSFMKSVPNAPKINPSEIDRLTFESAEKAYLSKGDITAIMKYLSDYPSGENRAPSLFYAAESFRKTGNSQESLKFVNTLINEYPHWQGTDDALLLKAAAETDLDMLPAALETYDRLESNASSAMSLNKARLGMMKTARDLGDGEKALAAADKLLSSSALESGEREEILFSRGVALELTGDEKGAVEQWKELTSKTDNLYGTKAAFYIANHYYNKGDLKNARKYSELLVNANTPHSYWLARTFILLSDINRSEGNEFEADEYLKSLRENYPGNEADIFTMIEQRLQK